MDCQSCQNCRDVSCQNRQSVFSALPPRPLGFGVLPVAVPLVMKFAPLAMSLIKGLGSLLGIKPRGNFQKFSRTLYPYMRTWAQQSGLPVYCMWFGDWVGVNPDGSYGVAIGKEQTASGYYPGRAEEETYLNGANPFYHTMCDRSDGDCVNHPEDGYFELYDPLNVAQGVLASSTGSPVSSTAGQDQGFSMSGMVGGNWLLIGVAGLAAWFFFGRKK